MKIKNKMANRVMSILLSIALLMTCVPNSLLVASADSTTATETVAAPGTAHTWETMLGTSEDGNRYAGRVWVDKSVYKNGEEALLNTSGTTGSKFRVNLEDDEEFQVIFSALGSSMTSTTTKTTTSGALDIILVLDNSDSMKTTSNRITRMERVIDAANELIENILSGMDVRLGIVSYGAKANEVLPFGKYTDGVTLSVNNYSNGGVISAHNNSDRLLGKSQKGYEMNTNTQAGFEMAVDMLTSATDIAERKPVVILLTDGAANTAVTKEFYNVSDSNFRQEYSSSTIHSGIALSTLLSVAYGKASIEDYYGKAPMVFGIGVDLSSSDGSNAIINPKAAFNSSNANSNIRTAYTSFATWSQGNNVEISGSNRSTFIFDHAYPSGSTVKDSDVIANINYVDTYYDVNTVDQSVDALKKTFEQIFEELSSAAFNPISSTTTTGGTGVDKTPLIYVDNIGQYMEIKEIQAVTLFGASYGVTKIADTTDENHNIVHNYVVQLGEGKNPTTNENYKTSEDIRIQIVEQTDGRQKLEIEIEQEILPIILEKVIDKTVGSENTVAINELTYNPLRIFYTIGVDSDILLPNGEIDVTKVDTSIIKDGRITLYSNAFGKTNTTDEDRDGTVDNGDAHVGFKPSSLNRYYYYQSNQGIFTDVKKDNISIQIPENDSYGILWDENAYDLTWMNYSAYKSMSEDAKVYTYVTFYRPTANTNDDATAAEKVTYLVYADWKYIKESVAFYDATTGKYINYNSQTDSYSLDDVGYVVEPDKIETYISNNGGSNVYAVIGVGSHRTSRFHNMIVEKTTNETMTADNSYVPEYTKETATKHHGNDVVVWLGNNGKVTKTIVTGIKLTKEVTEAIGNANDTYELTVTVPDSVNIANVEAIYENGNSAILKNSINNGKNVLSVALKAEETVYISGIPAGTVCEIGENISGDYSIYSIKVGDIESTVTTASVTVPSVPANLTEQDTFVQYEEVIVTNTPNKYGNLTIVKDILHHLDVMPEEMSKKAFTFKVQLPNTLVGKTYNVDKKNTTSFAEDKITVERDGDFGSFTVILKDNESITILDLPAGIAYKVIEISTAQGYENTTDMVSGTIEANVNKDAHFINTYTTTSIKPEITIKGKKILEDKNNTYTDEEEFTFILSKYVGVFDENQNEYVTLGSAKAKKDDSYSFNLAQLLENKNITLDIGEHYFRIIEQAGTTAGMTYDSTRGLFVVKVTDTDVNGVLEYTIEDLANTTIDGNTVTKDFTNTYDVDRTYVDINITKTLKNDTGVMIPMNIFQFKLVNTDLKTTDEYIATTDASGKATIRIGDLTGTSEGTTYQYKLTEVNGGMKGMRYSETEYVLNINVKNENGKLVAVANIGDATSNEDNTIDVSFENTYSLRTVENIISGTKVLNEKTLEDNKFQFALYETDSSFVINNDPIKVTNNVGNTFTFDKITYDKIGTYYYSVKEIKGELPGVTYDGTHYHVTVTVGIDDTGEALKKDISINKIGTNSDTTENIVFVNDYRAKSVEYVVSGTKNLTGRAMTAGEFTFELYEDGNSDAIQTVTNKADGTFSFNAIEYTKPGEFKYIIKEVSGNAPGVIYTGSQNPIEVTVTVVTNVNTSDNTVYLSASADKANTDITFENAYTASPVNVAFDGQKIFEGADLKTGDFNFKIYETDVNFDISQGKLVENVDGVLKIEGNRNSVGNKADGSFTFGTIEYAKIGTYFYSIVEDATNPKENVVYDSTQHNFRVQVSDDGTGQLKAEVLNVNTGEVTVSSQIENSSEFLAKESVIFTNATFSKAAEKEVYLSSDTTTVIDGQQVSVGDVLTYYITYTNYTGEHVVVDIRDTIPAYTSYVEGSASHNGTYAGAHLNWILDVHKGESVTVSFQVKVEEAEAIMTNSAVIFDGTNVYTTNVVKNHSIEDIVKKDVVLSDDPTVSIDGSQIFEGTELMYTIRYSNLTDIPVEVTIKDTIPAHTTYVEGSVDSNGTYANGELEWDLTVGAWESVLVSFKVMVVDEEVDVINKAYVLEGNNTYTSNEVKNYVNASSVPVDPIPEPTPVPIPDPTPDPGEDDGRIYKSFAFTKVWNDNNDKLGKRPDSITVELYQDGVYVTDVILSKENGWTNTAILIYANGDHVYEWTIKEKNVPAGYVASYNQSEYIITNTLAELIIGGTTPTGDNSNLGFFLGVAAVSLIAIIGLVVLMKFRKKDDE